MKMSGRRWMAGVMAAVMAMSALAGCSGGSEATEAAGTTEAAQETTAMAETTATAAAGGSFEGSTPGRNGDIKVSVTVDADGTISAIEVLESEETAGIGDTAMEQLIKDIVENQSIAVDSVSGATITSEGFLAAVEAALVSGGLDVKDYQTAAAKEAGEDLLLDTEIVIVGGGGAGLAAAASAGEKGAWISRQ